MNPSKYIRQWDIYKANLGQGEDAWLLVLSSTETNEILGSTLIACEVIPQAQRKIEASPVTIAAEPAQTGLEWPVILSVMTIASVPRNCLVSLEGRLEPINLRTAVNKGLNILFGQEPWP